MSFDRKVIKSLFEIYNILKEDKNFNINKYIKMMSSMLKGEKLIEFEDKYIISAFLPCLLYTSIIYGPKDGERQAPVVSINIGEADPSEISFILDNNYDIACRSGLHCAPLAHKTIGTFNRGTIRFSMGYFNTIEEGDRVIQAIEEISKWVG